MSVIGGLKSNATSPVPFADTPKCAIGNDDTHDGSEHEMDGNIVYFDGSIMEPKSYRASAWFS